MLENHIVFFDGVCNLCNNTVNLLMKIDPQERLKYASLQSHLGQKVRQLAGTDTTNLESIIYFKNGKIYQKSSAVLEIMKDLGGIWKSFYIFKHIPTFIRDPLYTFIAKNRYRLFGKRDSCRLPTASEKRRLLG